MHKCAQAEILFDVQRVLHKPQLQDEKREPESVKYT